LIADVGIIGFPNAGKSTLISVISAAKPKIADYPFTTLTPNLGVVRKPDGNAVVVADIPGLIEGASTGLGLGHEFLRHVERTRLLLHLVDISSAAEGIDGTDDCTIPVQRYHAINQELAKYRTQLAGKPQLVVLSKTDAVPPETLTACQAALQKEIGDQPLFMLSSVTRQGIEELLTALFKALDQLPAETEVVEVVEDTKAFDHDDSAFTVHRAGKAFQVIGGKVERLIGVTDLRNREAVHRLMNILKAMGVYDALQQAGAEEGDTVIMAGLEFEYLPD
jgi:GTP-binding protein